MDGLRRGRRLRHAGVGAAAAAMLLLASCGSASVPAPLTTTPRTNLISVAPAIDQVPTTIGFADSDLYSVPPDRVDGAMTQMRSTGARSVRILVPWAGVERTPGIYDWSVVDAMVDAAVAHHMSVLATLNSTPAWAVIPGLPPLSGRPAAVSAFGRFSGAVAAHFRGRVSAYEIWNEPNSAGFFAPRPNPAQYVDLLKSAYPAIKAEDASAVVVTGGLGPLVNSGAVAIDAVTFVRGMYAAGAKGYFDAIGYHPYQYTMKFSEGGYHPDSPLNQLAGIRWLMMANGDDAKKIWATEYGEPSSMLGEVGQADYLEDMLRTWRAIRYAGPVYVYTMRDRNTRSADPEDTLGVFRSDGTAKPAEGVFRSRAQQRGILAEQAISAPR